MARLIWDESGGAVITYASTNRWLRFALAWWERQAFADSVGQSRLTSDYDNLLPAELGTLSHRPAQNLMRHWTRRLFLDYQAADGLIASGVARSRPSCNRQDASAFDPAATHTVRTLRRMPEVLGWFPTELPDPRVGEPDNPAWLDACVRWADAVIADPPATFGHLPRTHRVEGASWRLYDFVGTADHLPNRRSTKIVFHAVVARALEHLARSLRQVASSGGPDAVTLLERADTYEAFARETNTRIWEERHNRDVQAGGVPAVFLAADCVSSDGPVAGDRAPNDPALDEGRWLLRGDNRPFAGHTFDTDCLYWARSLFRLYEEAGGPTRRDLRFTGTGRRDLDWQVDARKRRLEQRISSRRFATPDAVRRYLYIALGMTLDWLGGGWIDQWGHFSRKIFYEGDRAQDGIYGDGMWNTLFVLVEAYRVTGDAFYLEYAARAWETFAKAAQNVGEWQVNVSELTLEQRDALRRSPRFRREVRRNLWVLDVSDRRGLFHPLLQGELDTVMDLEVQDLFVDVAVRAHEATLAWGGGDDWWLEQAEELADRALSTFTRQDLPDPQSSGRLRPTLTSTVFGRVFHPTYAPIALLRLAQAPSASRPSRGALHRVAFRVPAGSDLQFTLTETADPPTTPSPAAAAPIPIHVEGSLAVVYMDPASYALLVTSSSGTTPRLVRIGMTEITVDGGAARPLDTVSETNPVDLS